MIYDGILNKEQFLWAYKIKVREIFPRKYGQIDKESNTGLKI